MPKGKRGFQTGRKNPNAGNKPDILKLSSREIMEGCINGDEGLVKLIKKCYSQAMAGSFKHQELILNYMLGKPIERIKLDQYIARGETIAVTPVIKILADHMRLEKLHKDIDDAKVVADTNHIQEMEDLLNNELEN